MASSTDEHQLKKKTFDEGNFVHENLFFSSHTNISHENSHTANVCVHFSFV